MPDNREPILIADDDKAFRQALASLFDDAGYATREAPSGEEALRLALAGRPAAAIVGVVLPGISGYEVCHRLREAFGELLPIVLTSETRTDPLDRVAGYAVGADDYLVRPFESEELLALVRRSIIRGRAFANFVPDGPVVAPPLDLTRREREVLSLLAAGLRQDEIGARLVISPKTVATHIDRILPKLGVHSRAEAVAFAHRHRLLQDVETQLAPAGAT
jgi:DNA-binding NarL/FixJ family response regulator